MGEVNNRKRGRPSKGSRSILFARVPVATAEQIRRAAELRGHTINDFIARAAATAAASVIRGK